MKTANITITFQAQDFLSGTPETFKSAITDYMLDAGDVDGVQKFANLVVEVEQVE